MLVLTSLIGLQNADDCGRRVTDERHYSAPVSDTFSSDDVGVVQVRNSGYHTSVTIVHPSGLRDPYIGFLQYRELTSTDGGKSWKTRSPLERLGAIGSVRSSDLLQAPSNDNFLYKLISETGTYLRSEDGGKTWLHPKYRIDNSSTEEFVARHGGNSFYAATFEPSAIDPREPLTIYATISVVPYASLVYFEGPLPRNDLPGMYVSHDGGDTWNIFSDALANSSPLGISERNRGQLYGQTQNGIVKSVDGGKTWSGVGQQQLIAAVPKTRANERSSHPVDLFELSQIMIDPSDDRTVYLISNKGAYRSTDGGNQWRLLDFGFDEIGGTHSMAIDRMEPNEIYFGTSRGLYVSMDKGCHSRKIYP